MSFALLVLDDVQRAGALVQQEGFEALYHLYHEPVRRYLCQLCGSVDQAEELAQETFLKAYTGLFAFRGSCSAATWLFRIAHNTYLNSRRRPHPAQIDTDELDAIPDTTRYGDPVERYAAGEQRSLIGRALAQLPEQQRSILLLRDAEGLAYVEIADVLGISIAAVRMKLFRARNTFRQAFRELEYAEGGPDAEL